MKNIQNKHEQPEISIFAALNQNWNDMATLEGDLAISY